jgi:CRISPR-associated protein Csb1
MTADLADAPRVVLHARLQPTVGSTFQPTGFPDLGAAEFQRPVRVDGRLETRSALLVESVQSMANRLEECGWDRSERAPRAPLGGLPYVEVRDGEGEFLSASRLEPHRLAGAYIKDAEIDGRSAQDWMIERLGVRKGVPLDWRMIYAAVFELDPLCLLHGVFFSDPKWSPFGNPRIRRAIASTIEAHDVQPVVSGGVKRDDVRPEVGEGRGAAEGYGFVPFGRTEYTADEVLLSAVVDLGQIRGYGLDGERTRLLTLIALWELASLLEGPLRLRTACDLAPSEVTVTSPGEFALPTANTLADEISTIQLDTERSGPWSVVWKK